MTRLRTRSVRDGGDIRAFFDGIADEYCESHGNAAALLEHRLALIRRLLAPVAGGTLLEIGCGTGTHLFALAGRFGRVIGTDLSPRMIEAAERIRLSHPCAARIELHVAPAETPARIEDDTADAVLCVGAFEHMTDKPAVLAEVRRVLRPGGRLACLTLNGGSLWYRRIAPWLGYETRHLTSDRLVEAAEMRSLLEAAGLQIEECGYWRFIARGDMPAWVAHSLHGLDHLGRVCLPAQCRGGLYACAA
ncbi:MAG: class I SAM-dependent methyltransferase [Burkholderiaceae bacterium]